MAASQAKSAETRERRCAGGGAGWRRALSILPLSRAHENAGGRRGTGLKAAKSGRGNLRHARCDSGRRTHDDAVKHARPLHWETSQSVTPASPRAPRAPSAGDCRRGDSHRELRAGRTRGKGTREVPAASGDGVDPRLAPRESHAGRRTAGHRRASLPTQVRRPTPERQVRASLERRQGRPGRRARESGRAGGVSSDAR